MRRAGQAGDCPAGCGGGVPHLRNGLEDVGAGAGVEHEAGFAVGAVGAAAQELHLLAGFEVDQECDIRTVCLLVALVAGGHDGLRYLKLEGDHDLFALERAGKRAGGHYGGYGHTYGTCAKYTLHFVFLLSVCSS